jgi:hypothetical protein
MAHHRTLKYWQKAKGKGYKKAGEASGEKRREKKKR